MAYEEIEGLQLAYTGIGSIWNATTKARISKTVVETLDLVSEGQISGLVDREYNFSGDLGRIGYNSYTETIFRGPSGVSEGKLRSIYLNKVPIVSDKNFYNFQTFFYESTDGLPNGYKFQYGSSSKLSHTRLIGEKFRYSDVTFNVDTTTYPDGFTTSSLQPIAGQRNYFKNYKILNKDCFAFSINLKISALFATFIGHGDEDDADHLGDVRVTTFQYAVFYRPIFSKPSRNQNVTWIVVKLETISGKVKQPLIYEVYLKPPENFILDKDFIGWELLLIRMSPEPEFTSEGDWEIQRIVSIDSLTEYYQENFVYPNSALVSCRFDSEYFSQIPGRSFDVRGLKVKVPTTYNSILRNYTEPEYGWDGTFKEEKEWTNNPVWCFYDLLINNRYGLGKYIDEDLIDIYSLYEISKYCDQLVSDENGNLEPRFTCNLLLNTREEAFKIISDMASIFRAITYYGFGTIGVSQDSEKFPITFFTNSNVEDSNFTYSSSSKKNRHNVAIVRYNDPTDFFKPALEVVEDFDSIRRNGINETDMTAFGCTSRAQAIRLGRWALLTENTETETINFKTGPNAALMQPGDVFGVVDYNRKMNRFCGRTLYVNNTPTGVTVILDNKITLNNNIFYDLSLIAAKPYYDQNLVDNLLSSDLPNFKPSLIFKQTFTGVKGTTIDENNKSIVYLPNQFSNFSNENHVNGLWTIELTSGNKSTNDFKTYFNSGVDFYRVISVEEEDDFKYSINGLQYNKDKYLAIDSGIAYQRSASLLATFPGSPFAIDLNLVDEIYSKIIHYNIRTNDFTSLTHFKVFVNTGNFIGNDIPDERYLVDTLNYNQTASNFSPSNTGNYYFRAYGYNSEGNLYSNSYGAANILVPKSPLPIQDIIISNLSLFGFTGNYNSNNVRGVELLSTNSTFDWQIGFKNPTNPFVPKSPSFRITVREPSLTPFPSTNIYYQTTGNFETNFSFPFTLNNSINGGPYRNYDVVVEAIDGEGNTSAGNILNPLSEEGWGSNLYGFDIININNPPVSGFLLSSGNYNPFDYASEQFFTASRDGIITFSGLNLGTGFSFDIAGGLMYTSPAYFTQEDVYAQRANITRKFCSWDDNSKTAFCSRILSQNYSPVQYIALSLFDIFDTAKASQYNNLYVCPAVPCSGELFGASLQLTTNTDLKTFTVKNVVNNNGKQELLLIDSDSPTLPSVLHTFA